MRPRRLRRRRDAGELRGEVQVDAGVNLRALLIVIIIIIMMMMITMMMTIIDTVLSLLLYSISSIISIIGIMKLCLILGGTTCLTLLV